MEGMAAISGQGSKRRRAPNKRTSTKLYEVTGDDAPKPPRIPDGLADELTPRARAAWREIHTSPVAALYTDADRHAVIRLVRLYASADKTTSSRTLIDISRECRALEQGLLINPRARAQARYETAKADEAERREAKRKRPKPVPPAKGADSDPRDLLVSGESS